MRDFPTRLTVFRNAYVCLYERIGTEQSMGVVLRKPPFVWLLGERLLISIA